MTDKKTETSRSDFPDSGNLVPSPTSFLHTDSFLPKVSRMSKKSSAKNDPLCGGDAVGAAVLARAPGSPRGRWSAGPSGPGDRRRRARGRGGGGGCRWSRVRGHGRGGGRRAAQAGALLPSRMPEDRGTAGTQRPDLSPGRVPGRRADAPRSRLLLGAYRPRSLMPPPPPPPPGARRRHPSPPPSASPGPAPPQPRGLRPPSRELPRAGRVPARAAGARGAGRMHSRRREAAAGPGLAPAAACSAPVPGGAETRSPRPAASAGLVGRGDGEEAAGVGTAAEPPPERPLMKAQPPPPGSLVPPPPGAPEPAAGQGPWGCLAPGPGPR
ncbi:basic proline-rich protein-like [Saccopteryx leptura]|uniref:basic proline-rich protein-like n=1 Tax=Saccopteryx leptura TaxID=249018 RepID=UPI00339C01A1